MLMYGIKKDKKYFKGFDENCKPLWTGNILLAKLSNIEKKTEDRLILLNLSKEIEAKKVEVEVDIREKKYE